MTSAVVAEQLNNLPEKPGVYVMKNARGNIIYIGKAAVLRNRVRQYFGAGQKLDLKSRELAEHAAEIDFFVTGSEQEALILEMTLIKRHHPRFNVQMRDDKSFPYLKIETGTDWPRVYSTRHYEENSGRYFGPFASAGSLKQSLKVIKSIFPFRYCSKNIEGVNPRACLEYHMGRCLGPCTGTVTRQEYADVINQVILFLEGKQDRIVREIKKKMARASEALEFERAARYRNQILSIQQVIEGQKIAARVRGDQDVFAFAQEHDQALGLVYFVRGSRLIGRESFVLQGTLGEEPSQVMTGFVKHFYTSSTYVPPLILLQYPLEDGKLIRDWLQAKRGSKVEVLSPERGEKKRLMDIVAENARQALEQQKIKQLASPRMIDSALEEVQKELDLKTLPNRIEAYDISNIQGTFAVGSMVVFEKGRPRRDHYRRFRIRTVPGANDYAMLQEVLRRRFKRAGSDAGEGWATLPDLALIDGGKGQLNAALEVMRELDVAVPAAGLAKENEEIFVPQRKTPVVLPASSPGLRLLQRLRDEAHRFAIGYYQKRHMRDTFKSALDGIPGIGPRRKRALLRHFGSVQKIKDASIEELSQTGGMSRKQAEKVKVLL